MSSTPRTRPSFGLLLGIVALVATVVAIAAIVASGADVGGFMRDAFYPPAAVTPQGQEIRDLYDIVFAIAVVIFLFVEGLIIWTVLRYRRKPGQDELPPQTHGHFLAEIVWTVVPTIIVAFLFVISWQTLNSVERVSDTPDVKIRAVAQQFRWTFDYLPANYDPDANPPVEPLYTQTIAEGPSGGLVVPVGRTVQLELYSPDVIHAFYVPEFLFKRDVVPGVRNVFEFTVNESDAGQTFRGQCAELCGLAHDAMTFEVRALTGGEFDAWLEERIREAEATPTPPPTGDPEGPTLDVVAINIAFDLLELSVPADVGFAINFDNQDPPGVPHDIDIRAEDGTVLQDQPVIDGGESTTYAYAPLEAGSYVFICSIHPIPAMTGTLTVGP